MTIKRILILLLAVLSISLTTNAQTLSKERKEKYQSKPSTVKKQTKRTNKKVARSLKKHPLTINKEDEGIYTASASGLYVMPTTPTVTHTIPPSGTIIFGAPNVGLGVLTIQKSNVGWLTSGTVAPSFSYNFGIGEYLTNPDGSLSIQPYVSFGAFLAVGYVASTNSASVQVGGDVAIYKYTTLCAGYDVVSKKPFIGVGASFSISNFKQGAGSTIFDTF